MAIAIMSNSTHNSTTSLVSMSRPIERLPVKKTNNDHKEAMNCKSCRKRKIKCNRLKPSCEACQVFNCACIYDAIPKKRGPKTDVLEALLKRVNGLEKRLKDEQKSASPPEAEPASPNKDSQETTSNPEESEAAQQLPPPSQPEPERPELRRVKSNPVPIEPAPPAIHEALAFTDALLDTYFARVHNKPYYILDETATRQRLRDGRLPRFLVNAIHAVSIRYVPHLCGGHEGAMRSSQDYAIQARAEIDVDEPSIDNLQALLLLTMANFQNGRGKRCYMVLTHAVSMAFALNLHRELPAELRIAMSEREGRRKLFWTCYLMDRFTVSGSKRPSLISDESIHLRLPGWQPPGSQAWMEGNFFTNGSSLTFAAGISNAGYGSCTLLVEIVRVLGVTNRYLGAGGVKGDSHFPWHAQSTLSRIRSDLDYWASCTQEIFISIDTLFGSHDSSTLVLSKLIYHLIHCLIYRPFLPIDLAELSGSGQNQSWQIEATNLCFLHANAIAELVEIGKNTALLDWPSFVGYAICTAGTIHVHGAHYMTYRDGDAFCHSAEFLSREMAQLNELKSIWAGIQHQADTLQVVYASHAQLVKSLASNPMRFSPVFQMEDFFDRYPGCYIDGAHVTFTDLVFEPLHSFENYHQHQHHQNQQDLWSNAGTQFLPHQLSTDAFPPPTVPSQHQHYHQPSPSGVMRSSSSKPRKRRSTTSSLPYPTPKAENQQLLHNQQPHQTIEEEEPQPHFHQPADSPHHDHNGNQNFQTHDPNSNNPLLYDPITRSGNGGGPGNGIFTPNFAFSPVLKPQGGNVYEQEDSTPSGASSHGAGGSGSAGENDPFLSLLEQLAENDGGGMGIGGFEGFLGAGGEGEM